MKNIEQFRATRREVADLRKEIQGSEDWWDETTPGYLYDYEGAQGYIEKTSDGRVYLIICNEDWIEDADKLPVLEQHLYDWMHSECGDEVQS